MTTHTATSPASEMTNEQDKTVKDIVDEASTSWKIQFASRKEDFLSNKTIRTVTEPVWNDQINKVIQAGRDALTGQILNASRGTRVLELREAPVFLDYVDCSARWTLWNGRRLLSGGSQRFSWADVIGSWDRRNEAESSDSGAARSGFGDAGVEVNQGDEEAEYLSDISDFELVQNEGDGSKD